MRRALLVDPNVSNLDLLRERIGDVVYVTACTDFPSARECLLTTSPAFLFCHFRIGPYNGLHLVHLALHASLETRVILFDEQVDQHLAHEAQLVGAFYETVPRLHFAIMSYLHADLPERDRRDVGFRERRDHFRGGRRATDLSPEELSGPLSTSLD